MHFTINPASPSSGALSEDARGSYRRLRRQALTLGGLTASFAAEAERVASTYATALQAAGDAEWAQFVAAAEALAAHARSLEGIVSLNESEREAVAYFAQIASENADLVAR
jgi:hypothetical protein